MEDEVARVEPDLAFHFASQWRVIERFFQLEDDLLRRGEDRPLEVVHHPEPLGKRAVRLRHEGLGNDPVIGSSIAYQKAMISAAMVKTGRKDERRAVMRALFSLLQPIPAAAEIGHQEIQSGQAPPQSS